MSAAQDSSTLADPEAELREEAARALAAMGFSAIDQDTIDMVIHAARLTPDDQQLPISTTRLFAGAVAVGKRGRNPLSYPVALDKAIQGDTALSATYQSILGLFKDEPVEAALERLRSQWFSDNTRQILQTAAREGGSLLPSDAIVQALVRSPSGLVRQRIDLNRLAKAIEDYLQQARTTPPRTLMEEIDALLGALKVPVTDAVRGYLLSAASQRRDGAELSHDDLFNALVETEHGRQGLPGDPTEMLKEIGRSMGEEWSPRPPPPLDTPASLSNPLRFSTTLEQQLRRGLAVQQRAFLNPALGTKGLLATMFVTAVEEDRPSSQVAIALERFQEIVRQRVPGDIEKWAVALERETRSLPKLNADQPGIGPPRDKLGIAMDALAIANVAAGKNTSLPLAFGIFGDWGAGKSFFMRLVQERIAGLVKVGQKEDGFEHAIVQIQFNAWHYAETNLWASLVGHIFDELDRWMTRDRPDESTKTADEILKRLSTSRQLTLQAASELVQRRKEHKRATAKLTDAQKDLATAERTAAEAPRTVWRTVVNLARNEIEKDGEIKQQLAGIQDALAMPALLENKAALVASLEQLERSASAGRAALGGLRSTLGNPRTIALTIVLLIGIPLLLSIGLPKGADIGSGFKTLAGLLGAASVFIGSFAKKTKALADKFVQLKKQVDAEIAQATRGEQQAAQDAAAAVAKSAATVDQAKTVVRATGEQVAAALKDYTEETGSLRISRFVRARAGAEGYGRHLGLVSTIRKDFDQLESLMLNPKQDPPQHLEEARKHYEARVKALIAEAKAEDALDGKEIEQIEATTGSMRAVELPETMAFRRIVLYIDDLDRCEPAKVVEVLQAVNMLLTFQLFVVMVAVDARWLSRSLEKQYPEFFGMTAPAGMVNGREDPKAEAGDGKPANEVDVAGNGTPVRSGRNGMSNGHRATTADYLEKIFQIPYWVPAMDQTTSKMLVGDLMAADRASEPGEGAAALATSTGQNTTTLSPGSSPMGEDDQPTSVAPPPDSEALRLTKDEIDALTELSPYLGGSPRRARRFVNVYRVAKASLPAGEVRKLEAGECRALATQLAIATGAPNAFAAWVELCAVATPDPLDQRISGIEASEEERQNISRAVAAFRKMTDAASKTANNAADKASNVVGKTSNADDYRQQLNRQSARAGRFSFATPRKASLPELD